ncbi:MAG: galactose mutarotase [Bacteroidaceae bacterium]|nr:galactose mutarotase [Bacteroidaceae bacterium]
MRNLKSILTGSAAAVAFLCACNSVPQQPVQPELTQSGINPADYDTCIAVAYDAEAHAFVADTANAKQVKLYTLTNANGMEVCITNFGGRIVSIMVPNKDGELVDVACGFDKVENYFPWIFETDFGCSVGRYANRINDGKYSYNGEIVTLPKNNNGVACLHGGFTGWQYQVYDVVEATDQSLTIKRVSPAGDNQFPGNVEATVKFELTDDNAIVINYDGTTDAPTVLNMTNHTYFNLSGDLNNTIDESVLYVNADSYTPGDRFLIPTGEIRSVEGTVFDFRTPKAIGTDFDKNDAEMISVGGGYDHNWCLNTKGNQDKIAATMTDPRSGIKLDVYTNEPGIQCYTANFQDGTRPGKGGIMYQKHCAICLESQKYPDSPNKCMMPGWEQSNPFITPEKPYHSYCKYAFSVVAE